MMRMACIFEGALGSSLSDLLWMNNANAIVPGEIINVKADDVFDPVHVHSCDDSCVVCFRTGNRMSADELVPLSVDILDFENKEKERFEACDITSDSCRRVSESIFLSCPRTHDPELSRDLGKNIESVLIAN